MLHFSGQVNGWTALPSTYAIEAQDENDVVNAVKFAKDNNLRLVVKGTGNKTDSKVTNYVNFPWYYKFILNYRA